MKRASGSRGIAHGLGVRWVVGITLILLSMAPPRLAAAHPDPESAETAVRTRIRLRGGDPPLTLLNAEVIGGQFRFTFSTLSNTVYRIQTSASVPYGGWSDVRVEVGTGAGVCVTDTLDSGVRYYRVLTEDPAWLMLLSGEEDVAAQAGPVEELPLADPPAPRTTGDPPALAANAEEALLGVLRRIEGPTGIGLLGGPEPTSVVRQALLPLYMRVLRRLVDSGALETAIRSGTAGEDFCPDPILTDNFMEDDLQAQCEASGGGGNAGCDRSRLFSPLRAPVACEPAAADLPPRWEEVENPAPPPLLDRRCGLPVPRSGLLSESAVGEALGVAQSLLAAYDQLVQKGVLIDDLPSMDPPPPEGAGGAGLHQIGDPPAPITVNPEFAKLFLRRLAPDLRERLAPVSAFLVEAMRARENPGGVAPAGSSYQKRSVDFLKVLREHPTRLAYFNREGTRWANQWGFRARLPRFWLVEKHDPGGTAEPYFVKLVSTPALDLSRSGSYGKGYKSGKVMAVSGKVTEEYPLKQGERRGLNPPDNFLTPYSWTGWTPSYGLPITFSAQCWEQDQTQRSDVIEGVRRAAAEAEKELFRAFFDSVMEGFLQELGEQMEEMAERKFEQYRNQILQKLRDLMKQTAGAESVAEYLSKLLGVDVSTLVAGLNFLFDPSEANAMNFINKAFGPGVIALLAGGPVGVVLGVVLDIVGKAFEHADSFLEFVKGLLDSIVGLLGTVLDVILKLLEFTEFFQDILAMLFGDDLLGTATATAAGDTGDIEFPGWSVDERRRHDEIEELGGKLTYREHPDKSVTKAQFDWHRVLHYQWGERRYIVSPDHRDLPQTLGYSFTMKTRGVVAVEVTRLDKSQPFPQVYVHAGGNAYYRTYESTSKDGMVRRVEVTKRPIPYNTTMKVYLKANRGDQPYCQAGRWVLIGRYDH
ncbi:MAG TPA: hypothetical protein PKM73_02135 [Verrucomicrobiota bacterium]|nr:hypothetical protein [Verrucomicrobiota bacterium]HNU50352.1 hypothetical protein [Verrucomicrobiota bacterium]